MSKAVHRAKAGIGVRALGSVHGLVVGVGLYTEVGLWLRWCRGLGLPSLWCIWLRLRDNDYCHAEVEGCGRGEYLQGQGSD